MSRGEWCNVSLWQYLVCILVAAIVGGFARFLVQFLMMYWIARLVVGATVLACVGFYVFSVMEDVFLDRNLSKEERKHGRD